MGVSLVDDPEANLYPMPLTATGEYDVEVGDLLHSCFFFCGLCLCLFCVIVFYYVLFCAVFAVFLSFCFVCLFCFLCFVLVIVCSCLFCGWSCLSVLCICFLTFGRLVCLLLQIQGSKHTDLSHDVDRSSRPHTPPPPTIVQVGRVRANDVFGEHGLDLFVCGDQLLRGAALNAVLIAEALAK